MNDDYIDNTIEAIMKAFEKNKMENLEQYQKLKNIEERRKNKWKLKKSMKEFWN